MERKIYLPNTTKDSLKVCSVNYDEKRVYDYINQESLKLGAEKQSYGRINPVIAGISIPEGSRIYKASKWCPEIETHDFWNGWSRNSHFEDQYTIFSNEDPIIRKLKDTLKVNEDWLSVTNDQEFIFKYLRSYSYPLNSFFQKYYSPNRSISFGSLVPYLKNKEILLDFLKLFRIENKRNFGFEEVHQDVLRAVEYYENNLTYDFFDVEPLKKQMLEYFKREFDRVYIMAKKNQKVLSLRKDGIVK